MLMRALLPLRMRPRVQRAPGIPCALWFMEGKLMAKTRAHRVAGMLTAVIPGREAKRREPGIHPTTIIAAQWIPGSRCARPGMTKERQASGASRDDESPACAASAPASTVRAETAIAFAAANDLPDGRGGHETRLCAESNDLWAQSGR